MLEAASNTASIYETTSSMRETYTLNLWPHSRYLCHHTHCIDKITPTLFVTSHSPYVWHRLLCTRHNILTFWPQTTILRTSHELYYKSCLLYLCHYTNLSMISQTLYVWYYFLYMGDNISTIFLISYPLCMTTQPLLLIRPHSAYVWQHLCYRRRHIRSITPSQNLYDFTSTSGMTSNHLYQKSQQLYHCHHNLSTEITPTFYFITPTISVTSYALYITSYPLLCHQTILLMTAQTWHMKPLPVCSSKYTLPLWHHSH